ncbi:DNA replication complex GINS protein SLD5 [Harpegnathos saltator]|uniref:DNA replication complex GINS protein SLD5 n=1 Tax=Harpegnathos saltator TaxID=610380 RepID=E2C456_HARSA|nr:DNA replication complex GINS protein SLD5 [Harpegnathos saltator]EFN77285.1 DNA replication complex GINS protein SLD5 [Harpegnathos saltator]
MEESLEESLVDEVEDDDVGELTAQDALQAIENAWMNEKFAPEILPHQSNLVDCMLQQIAHMERNIKRLDRSDLRMLVHRMEVERIRYMISSYLRTRLEKIERYTLHILSEEASRSEDECYLTPGELRFAKEFLAGMETLFKTVALQHMPPNFQRFEVNKFTVKPNMQAYVFLRANQRVTGVVLHGALNEEIDFDAGSQHIVQYSAVAHLVKSGVVQLI